MLKARTENFAELTTIYKGQGLISRKEILPGIYMAESIIRGIESTCIMSIVNTLEEDVTILAPLLELEEIEEPLQADHIS
jgi:hypothetical protein